MRIGLKNCNKAKWKFKVSKYFKIYLAILMINFKANILDHKKPSSSYKVYIIYIQGCLKIKRISSSLQSNDDLFKSLQRVVKKVNFIIT